GGASTQTTLRFLANVQHMLRADHVVVAPVQPRLADRLVRIAGDAAAATTVMVLSDYGKGVLLGDTPARLIQAARAAGRPVVVDPKGRDYGRYAGADLVTPNRAELAEATGMAVDTEDNIIAALRALRDAHGFGAV
ncbi:MAG: PfkB family carbohydrate kinase, partial [Alphaproteobacteria bacterium]